MIIETPDQLVADEIYKLKYKSVDGRDVCSVGRFVRMEADTESLPGIPILWLYFSYEDELVLEKHGWDDMVVPVDWNSSMLIEEMR